MQGFASIICVEAISSPWRIFLQCFEDTAVLEELIAITLYTMYFDYFRFILLNFQLIGKNHIWRNVIQMYI